MLSYGAGTRRSRRWIRPGSLWYAGIWSMWVKKCYKHHPLGDGVIPLINMVMIGGGVLSLLYPHYFNIIQRNSMYSWEGAWAARTWLDKLRPLTGHSGHESRWGKSIHPMTYRFSEGMRQIIWVVIKKNVEFNNTPYINQRLSMVLKKVPNLHLSSP